jgi:WD40 repeat protein
VQHINAEHQHPEWPVSACAFDGNRRALVTAAKKVLIWPQKSRTVASGHESAITSALFNPLFNLVVSGDDESLVTLWDLETGNPMFRFKNCHGLQKITAMAFDKTARRLITAGHMDPEGVVKVWNFSTGEVLLTLKAPPQDVTNIMHLDIGNAKYFVGVGWGRCVIIWPDILVSNNETIEIKKLLTGHKEDIQCMDFMLPNCLATGSYDGEILLWNLDSLTLRTQNPRLVRPEVDTIPHSRRGIESLKFITCKNRHCFILSTGGDMKIHVWNMDRGSRVLSTPPSHTGADSISCMEICVDQQLLFTADNSGFVQTWDIAGFIEHTHELKPGQFAIAHAFRCHASAISSLQYISSRMLLVTGSADFTVAAWSISGSRAFLFFFRLQVNVYVPLNQSLNKFIQERRQGSLG